MLVHEVQQVGAADEFYPRETDEIDREQCRDAPERERADDAVAKRLPLPRLRKTEYENCEDHRVVDAEQTFERDEQRNCQKIRRMNHYLLARGPTLAR